MNQPVPSTDFLTRVFGEWRAEFRAILEGHKKDINDRLDKVEANLEKKSDKEHVEILVRGLQDDLRRHAAELDQLQEKMVHKLNTESLWKVIGLVLTIGSMVGGLIGFAMGK